MRGRGRIAILFLSGNRHMASKSVIFKTLSTSPRSFWIWSLSLPFWFRASYWLTLMLLPLSWFLMGKMLFWTMVYLFIWVWNDCLIIISSPWECGVFLFPSHTPKTKTVMLKKDERAERSTIGTIQVVLSSSENHAAILYYVVFSYPVYPRNRAMTFMIVATFTTLHYFQ